MQVDVKGALAKKQAGQLAQEPLSDEFESLRFPARKNGRGGSSGELSPTWWSTEDSTGLSTRRIVSCASSSEDEEWCAPCEVDEVGF